jgi:hypothetical protein
LNHREWLERRRGEFVRFLHPDPVSREWLERRGGAFVRFFAP